MKLNPKVDQYINGKSEKVSQMLLLLRELISPLGYSEDFKWNNPVYSSTQNLFALGGFKTHVSIGFFNGVNIPDKFNLFMPAKETTKAMRTIKLNNIDQIEAAHLLYYFNFCSLPEYLVTTESKAEKTKVDVPAWIVDALKQNTTALEYFESLATGYHNEYIEHITSAKRHETQLKRLDKSIELLANHKKLNEKYMKK